MPVDPEEFIFVDRCALIVKPTWKFAEWVNQLEAEPLREDESVYHQTVYLVEEVDRFDAATTTTILESCYLDIAANEFAAWWTMEEDWPPIRNLNDFFQFFECTPSEMVVDLVGDGYDEDLDGDLDDED